MGTTSSSGGVERTGHGVYHPPPCSTEVKQRAELDLYSFPEPSWRVRIFTFDLFFKVRPGSYYRLGQVLWNLELACPCVVTEQTAYRKDDDDDDDDMFRTGVYKSRVPGCCGD